MIERKSRVVSGEKLGKIKKTKVINHILYIIESNSIVLIILFYSFMFTLDRFRIIA